MADQTWIAINQAQQGPFNIAELRDKMARNEINGLTLYWQEGMSGWRELREWNEVFSASPQAISSPLSNFRPAATTGMRAPHRDAVLMREAHIKHEAALGSVGLLYYLFGMLILFSGAAGFAGVLKKQGSLAGPTILGMMIVMGVIALVIGRMYRKLSPAVKVPGTIFAVIGLLGFPLGTLLNVYVLYLLYSEKGKVVLSADYQEIMAETPKIKYRTSIILKILAWILGAFLLFALFGVVIERMGK